MCKTFYEQGVIWAFNESYVFNSTHQTGEFLCLYYAISTWVPTSKCRLLVSFLFSHQTDLTAAVIFEEDFFLGWWFLCFHCIYSKSCNRYNSMSFVVVCLLTRIRSSITIIHYHTYHTIPYIVQLFIGNFHSLYKMLKSLNTVAVICNLLECFPMLPVEINGNITYDTMAYLEKINKSINFDK